MNDQQSRHDELRELSKSNPAAVLELWRQSGGVPPGGNFEGEVVFENVVIPAILKSEFPDPGSKGGGSPANKARRSRRDKTKVNPASGSEDDQPPEPLKSVPEGRPANATNAVIPGTGEVIHDVNGREAKRVTRT